MTTLELDETTGRRVSKMAEMTGCSEDALLRKAVAEHLEDLEDYYAAVEAMKNPGRLYSSDEVERELGL